MARLHSLLVRFFLISVVIAGCSIGVTAWLATQTTTGSIRQEQGEALATDAELYDQLLGYAATHPNWTGVQPTIDALAKRTGRRIALTTKERKAIADSGDRDAPPLPVRQTVVVDPLGVDLTLKPGAPTDQIDPRAVGPFLVTPADRVRLRKAAERVLACASELGGTKLVTAQNGRTRVEFSDGRDDRYYHEWVGCERELDLLTPSTQSETTATDALQRLLDQCLVKAGLPASPYGRKPMGGDFLLDSRPQMSAAEQVCFDSARRQQLTPYVAPAALLFLTSRTGATAPRADLSQAGATRIAVTALAILAVAMFAAWLAALQLARPIRAVTAAARRMGAGDRSARVARPAKGELGELADAFNVMSQQLDSTERQRKALVSDIAHELRTPLGNITGWLEATQDGLATADAELIEMLLKESFLLQYLVNDLQDLAQADAGNLRLHPEPIDVRDLVDQVTAAHQAQADDAGVVLRAATRGSLQLSADPARLRQALGNLVANAVRYTPPGGEVTVTGRRDEDSILLEVTDTGSGIGADDLPHVFERFWRADKSRSRTTGGSGLGLAIARHLAEAHGGSASATSEPGKGSTFRLLLPLSEVPADEVQS